MHDLELSFQVLQTWCQLLQRVAIKVYSVRWKFTQCHEPVKVYWGKCSVNVRKMMLFSCRVKEVEKIAHLDIVSWCTCDSVQHIVTWSYHTWKRMPQQVPAEILFIRLAGISEIQRARIRVVITVTTFINASLSCWIVFLNKCFTSRT